MRTGPAKAIQWTSGATTRFLRKLSVGASDEEKRTSTRQGRGQTGNQEATAGGVLMR